MEQTKILEALGFNGIRCQGDMGSSSSSTLVGTPRSLSLKLCTPANECTELLLSSKSKTSTSRWAQTMSPSRGCLTYKPDSIPVVDNTLPSNSMSLIIVIVIGANLLYAFYRLPFTIPMLFVFAERTQFAMAVPLCYQKSAYQAPYRLLLRIIEQSTLAARGANVLLCFTSLQSRAGLA